MSREKGWKRACCWLVLVLTKLPDYCVPGDQVPTLRVKYLREVPT